MTAAVVTPNRARDGLRRIRPASDLPALADLIEVAYRPELALTGSNLVERLRQYASMAAFLGFAGRLAPLLDGFVWFEDDLLVGNVTLNRDATISGGWTISNVAVLPEYRGRGIAGRLVDAALAQLDDAGARCVRLQVRTDNAAAVALYRHRGFAVYETTQEMRLAHRDLCPSTPSRDRRIGPPRLGDPKRILRLAQQDQPVALRYLQPLHRTDLGLTLWQRALHAAARGLGLDAPRALVARSSRSPVGYAYLAPVGGGTLGLRLHLASDQAQDIAAPLIQASLAGPAPGSWSQVVAEIPAEASAIRSALDTLGFEPLRTLYGMIWEPPQPARRRGITR